MHRAIVRRHGAGAPTRGDIVTTQSRGPWAGFEWLQRGISVGFRHPKPIYAGAIILLLLVMLPSLAMLPFQFHLAATGAPPNPAPFASIMAASMLLGLLIVPLYAGYLRLIDAAERGLPAHVGEIFSLYRHGGALRLIGYGVTLIVIYVVLIAIVILAAGRGIVDWYMQVLAAQAQHSQPPGLPQGFGIAMALFTVIALFMMGFYSVSLGQVALRDRRVVNAIGDGFLGALKNLLPLIVLAISLIVAWIALVIVFVIVGFIVGLLGVFVGKWLLFAVFIPIYIAMMLVMFAVMFGVMYHLWRDVCGGGALPGAAETIAA